MKPQPDWGPLKKSDRTGMYDIDLTASTFELVDWAGRLYNPETITQAKTSAGTTVNVATVTNYSGPVPVILNVKERFLSPTTVFGTSVQLPQTTTTATVTQSAGSSVDAPATSSTRQQTISGVVPTPRDASTGAAAGAAAPAAETTSSAPGQVGGNPSNVVGNLQNPGGKGKPTAADTSSRSSSKSKTQSLKDIHHGTPSKRSSHETVG